MSHHIAMFGRHWSSTSGGINYLTCHVTLQNHMMERPGNFMSENSPWYIGTLKGKI